MASNIRFKNPFTCIIGGPTGSGRSTFCTRLLPNLDTLCTEHDFLGGIICCYSEQIADYQLTAIKNVKICEGLPENFENVQGLPCLFILDDLLN
jgi:pantothenate kinase-related protein Tda10